MTRELRTDCYPWHRKCFSHAIMRSTCWLLLGVISLLIQATATELRISAAASLTEAIQEAAQLYETQTGIKVSIALGGSQTLARQIEAGAPVDLFLSANAETMDRLASKGHVLRDTARPMLSNRLVVIAPTNSKIALNSAAGLRQSAIRRISIGDPELVPAGIYAKAWLLHQDLWKQIIPRMVGMENVRGALATVEAGNAEVGIVYRTDALISRRVRVVHLVAEEEHPPILYPGAVCASTDDPAAATRLLQWLSGPDASAIFRKHGFSPVESPRQP